MTVDGRRETCPTIVLVAHAVHDRGGMERVTAELIRRAHSRWRFVVVAVDLAPELRPLVEWHRIRVPRRPAPLRFACFFLVAGSWIARNRRGLVHTVGAIVPNRVDLATVHYCHATAPHEERRREMSALRRANSRVDEWISTTVERWCYTRRVRVLAAVASPIATDLIAVYPGIPVEITPNGVDTDHFRPDGARREAERGARGVGPDDVVALFVGGDWGRKGLYLVLEALSDPGVRDLPLRLWVVGPGDVEAARRRAAELGVSTRVEFLGAVADPAPVYSAADVFVMPSAYEAASLALLEAAASGLALVVTAVGDAAELVGDGGAGAIVPRDSGALARALVTLAVDAESRRRSGAAARESVMSRDWARSIAATTDQYERLEGSCR